jgi:hypothetical protein
VYLKPMLKRAVFLNGPIGSGKTTLGRALAHALGGTFLDGDAYADPDRPWYASILRTSRAVVRVSLTALDKHPFVVIAYPLACSTWLFYRRHLAEAGVHSFFIGLSDSYEAITAESRGRRFSNAEKARIKVMIREGYGRQAFNDLIIDTSKQSFPETVARLASEVTRLGNSG